MLENLSWQFNFPFCILNTPNLHLHLLSNSKEESRKCELINIFAIFSNSITITYFLDILHPYQKFLHFRYL